MSKKDIKLLEDKWESIYDNSMRYVRMGLDQKGVPVTDGILAGIEVTPGYPVNTTRDQELIPVYEVEWLETDNDFVM